MVITGYSAAKLTADMNTPKVKPGNKVITFNHKRLLWEDATEQQKQELVWITATIFGRKEKSTILPLSEGEKIMRKENNQYHCEQMFQYLLKHYGTDYAYRFAEECIEKDMEVCTEKYPHCVYNKGQCDIFCDFYEKGVCIYGGSDNT